MTTQELKIILEALIFASRDPLTVKDLLKLVEGETKESINEALAALRQEYGEMRGLQLVEVAHGYQIVTRPELNDWVRRLFQGKRSQRLTMQALETLALIAYKQPVTLPEIDDIRGVSSVGVVHTLLERRLVKITGRKDVVGRPFLYATTQEFLLRFGLRDLSELPRVEELADVLGAEVTGAEPATVDGSLPLADAPRDVS